MPNLSDLQKVAEFATKAMDAIMQAIALGQDVSGIVSNSKERLEAMASQGRGPTSEEWSAQDNMKRELTDKLNSDDR